MEFRLVPALLAVGGMLTVASAAPATADQQQQSLSATIRVSLTILASATVGRDAGRSTGFIARGYDGRDLGRTDVQVVFRDGRGERVLGGVEEIETAVRRAQRAGDDHVDVTFRF